MRYYKIIRNGYLMAIGTGSGGREITESEYNNLLGIIRNKPIAESGFDYRLKSDLSWELYELQPITVPEDEEATEADYKAALAELGVSE